MLHTRIFWSFCFVFLLTSWGSAQISADFSASITTGCGSLQVSFTDESTSTNPINDWSWDLGGVSAGTQNPGRIFGTPGNYDICLTVTDTQGNTDTNCKTEYIQVFPLPTPDFIVSGLSGCAPLEVVFSDQSVSEVDIEEWIWGVGGSSGVIVTSDPNELITNSYNTPDIYTVSLTIQDANNCSNTVTRSDMITVFPDPEVDVTIVESFSCNFPFAANFINNNPAGNLTYVWNFGNGESFTGEAPLPVIYSAPGTYDITVTAMDQNTNCTTTEVFNNILQVGYPVEIDYSSMDNCQRSTFSFMDNSTEPADSVFWDFGDGNFSTEVNPQHSFDQGGCFSVSLIRYTQGCPSEGQLVDCLLIEAAPIASLSNNNPAGCTLPHTVSYSTNADSAVTWLWNFGDGTTSIEPEPTHTYGEFGEYPVRLRITNNNGCVNVYTDTVRVIETAVQLTGPDYWGCTPYEFTLDESSATAVPINTWEWNIFDQNNVLVFTSNEENPTHTLVDTGLYNVQLTVVNVDGCSSTGLFEGAVAIGQEVIPNFSATPLETCIDAVVSFTDLSSSNANFWIWDFGDGVVVEDIQNPSHEYIDTGYFDVQLFAFHYGCFSEIRFEDLIHVNPPIGGALIERNCDNPYAITFADRSFGVDSVYWDFGEENLTTDTSTILSPTHIFADTGCYKVVHSVFNITTDCVDHDTINVCISDPRASFNLNNTDGCAPLAVTVDNNSIFAETFEWIAPDAVITGANTESPTFTFNTPGIYNDVMLVISDIQECPDTFRTIENIFARGLVVNFNTDITGGCLPLTVNFSDNSTSAFSTPLTWSWNIGNGLFTSDQENFTYTFDTVGNFGVELIVTDGDGCTVRKNMDNVIEVTDPKAIFTADTTSCTADLVRFQPLATGGTLTYLWDFGDGNTSTEVAPEHNYLQEGSYDVCLSIVNQYGCTDMQCKENYITIADPMADFTVDSTFAFCPPLLARFTNLSTNANYYEWNFGDISGSSDLENPPHVYTIPGSYSVQLIAGSTENCRDTLIINDLITLNGPVGDFDFVIDTSCAPMQVHFTGSSTDFYDYIWDYGNGVLDTTLNVNSSEVTYVYQTIDTYVPKLILIDESNCARAIESPDSILVTGINVDFLATDSLLCGENMMTSLINLSQSTTPITGLEWILPGSIEGNTTDSEPTITYPNSGVYDVSLFVTTEFCEDTLTKPNYVRIGSTPEINFQASETIGCEPFSVNFNDMSTTETGAIANWAWNFGNGEIAGQPNPTHVFNTAGNYQTVLTVGTDFGCEASDSIAIEVLAAPVVTLAPEQSICRGEVIMLSPIIDGVTDQLTFMWSGGGDLSCSTCLEPTVSPIATTTYEFTATNPAGCTMIQTTTVFVLATAIPEIGITPDTAICVSDGIQLKVTGGSDVFSYEWDESRPGLTCYQFCANPIANPLAATTYVVTVTNGEGCSAIDSVTIDLVDQFQPLSGEDRTICEGDSVTLTTGVAGLEWTNPVNLSCAYCPDPIAFPDSSIIYRLETFTEEGCLIQDSVLVTVLTQAAINAGEDVFLCEGGSIILNGIGVGEINWSPDVSLSNPSSLNAIASPMITTTYRLSLTQDNCVLTDSVVVNVVDKTTIEAEGADICNGDTISLLVTGNADIFEWTSPESLSNPNSPFTDAFPNTTTTYTVVGTLTNCPADTVLVTVNVDEGPSVSLSEVTYALPDFPLVIEPTVDTTGNYQYSWFPADGLSCTECLRPIVDSAFIGQTYTLLVTDMETGCEKELSTVTAALISCPDEILWVPSAFSPNDDGRNDELKVNSGTLNEITSFQIFDRWGALIFRTDDMRLSWDGRVKGERMPIGVYVYFVEATCPVNNLPILIKGDVTLVR